MNTTTLENTAQAIAASMTPKFAVSYLRVSTRGQAERGGGNDEGFSIPAQREANRKKALSMGAIVGKEFVDRGASAKSADRPELQAMLKYVKENADRIDYVIVHKVDRLARNRDDDSDIMRVLRECGVQLVSASESIDDTPAGMLLHGIMSSIAEFYSRNLANEVKKGMGEKVKSGGTPSKAPIGYINVRHVDEKGREERTVMVDPDRAPLIKQAFEEYSTGEWSLSDLVDRLNALGLRTRATPKLPSKEITKSKLESILKNPYYAGIVRYDGVEYDGIHEPIISLDLFNNVQTILHARINGDRARQHDHFLKGLLYCSHCGSRMLITNAKSCTGNIYPYFICAGRHRTKLKDKTCDMKAVLIDAVEYQMEKIFDQITITPSERILIEQQLQSSIDKEEEKFNLELRNYHLEKDKIERQQKKLLEAHFNDAIPLSLLKSEQERLSRQLAAIEHEIAVRNTTFSQIKANLTMAFDLIENCGNTYRRANDSTKRLMVQALFKKVWLDRDENLMTEYNDAYKCILGPAENRHACQNEKSAPDNSDADFSSSLLKSSSNFFGNSLTNDVLVRLSENARKALTESRCLV